MSEPLLVAALIVRDEADEIAGCIGALAGLVDEVLVYDTGSTDDTVSLALAAGARVVEGYWDGDLGRARTDAAAAASARWLLVIDADERVQGDPVALRSRLAGDAAADAFSVLVHDAGEERLGGGYVHWAPRVVRRDAVVWAGRVHEQPVGAGDAPLRVDTMPAHLLSIDQPDASDPDALRRKGERNAALAEAELQGLLRLRPHDSEAIAVALLHLGRSLMSAGREQDAVDTFEALRELAPGTPQWGEATDFLARLLLGAGHDEAVVLLSDQLRGAGADARYCDWLRAQALAQLGAPQEALDLVRGIDELIDPAGRRYDVGQVLEVRALLAAMLGHRDEALGALAQAMADHGRVHGRGAMLLEIWSSGTASGEGSGEGSGTASGEGSGGARGEGAEDGSDGADTAVTVAELVNLMRRYGSRHLSAVARELREAGGSGPDVALALGA